MTAINMPAAEQAAIGHLDTSKVDAEIREAIKNGRSGALPRLLSGCGPHISRRLHYFEAALQDHVAAKGPRKREQTENLLRKARYDLSFAVSSMQTRVALERADAERFFVDDVIHPPFRFGPRLDVSIGYRWRSEPEVPWSYGCISFLHTVDGAPGLLPPLPRGTRGAAQRERDREATFEQAWSDLVRGALYSVRDYFREDGDGAAIPETWKVKSDPRTGALNNRSTRFWTAA